MAVRRMTSRQFKNIRKRLGLTAVQMGRALGSEGSDASTARRIYGFESGRTISPSVSRLVTMYAMYGIPKGWLS
jgi:transcriptional regulator with XRE-family HTH domain